MAATGAADSGRAILSEEAARIKPGFRLFLRVWSASNPGFRGASRPEMPWHPRGSDL